MKNSVFDGMRKEITDLLYLTKENASETDNEVFVHLQRIMNEILDKYEDKLLPTAVYRQVAWERSVAEEQLHDLGYELGERVAKTSTEKLDKIIDCLSQLKKEMEIKTELIEKLSFNTTDKQIKSIFECGSQEYQERCEKLVEIIRDSGINAIEETLGYPINDKIMENLDEHLMNCLYETTVADFDALCEKYLFPSMDKEKTNDIEEQERED